MIIIKIIFQYFIEIAQTDDFPASLYKYRTKNVKKRRYNPAEYIKQMVN